LEGVEKKKKKRKPPPLPPPPPPPSPESIIAIDEFMLKPKCAFLFPSLK